MPALRGIKVVELGDFISASYCGKLLADLGAEVVKVEPLSGDSARRYGPFPGDIPHQDKSGLFLYLNTSKLGITLNVEDAKGREILQSLLDRADVLVENLPAEALPKLSLDYASLKASNPGLVVTSISPFGRTGPYANRKAYEINMCALGGVSYVIGEVGRTPLTAPCFQSDYQGGLVGVGGAMAALFARRQIKQGQHVDISILDIWCTIHPGSKLLNYVYFGGIPDRREGRRRRMVGPVFLLPCKDGYIGISIQEDHQWAGVAKIVGDPELVENPRYKNRRAMVENYIEEVEERLIPRLRQFTQEELFQPALRSGTSMAPVRSIDRVVNCEHLNARNFFVEAEHPLCGRLKYPVAPFRLSETPASIQRSAPALGEHNYDVLCGWLGYTKADLVALRQTGVI